MKGLHKDLIYTQNQNKTHTVSGSYHLHNTKQLQDHLEHKQIIFCGVSTYKICIVFKTRPYAVYRGKKNTPYFLTLLTCVALLKQAYKSVKFLEAKSMD